MLVICTSSWKLSHSFALLRYYKVGNNQLTISARDTNLNNLFKLINPLWRQHETDILPFKRRDMIKMLFIILSLFASLAVECKAQGYPSEWVEYTYSGYLYAIESDNNYKNLSETDFKNYLLDIARTNLAKQIQIRVHDVADLNKQAINGRTSIEYSSQTNFSTDVNLKLLETKTIYDTVSKKGYAIAYINRNNACNYYQNELTLIYTQITNSISIAEDFISEGFKSKAQSELEASRELLEMKNEPLFWINIFGAPQSTLIQWQDTFNSAEQCIESILEDLEH